MRVIGADVNRDFVNGTRANLIHMGLEGEGESDVQLFVKVSQLYYVVISCLINSKVHCLKMITYTLIMLMISLND